MRPHDEVQIRNSISVTVTVRIFLICYELQRSIKKHLIDHHGLLISPYSRLSEMSFHVIRFREAKVRSTALSHLSCLKIQGTEFSVDTETGFFL